MKRLITIIIIIIIVAIGGFMLFRDGATTGRNTVTNEMFTEGDDNNDADMIIELEDGLIDTTAEVIIVTYGNDGFSPKEIAVSQGQIVRFVNESSGNMWVASDVHPTHKIMPEFDNKKSIGNGESYEFAFTKVGEWKYHNHVKPSAVGIITVK
ncbi:MAG: plastocyanin/azurin family copper-binding protein [Patescibacteria group bacterium]